MGLRRRDDPVAFDRYRDAADAIEAAALNASRQGSYSV
jgi:hypothetical protein